MSISSEDLMKLKTELQALPPKPKLALTAKDVVTALAPEIREKIENFGYSHGDIVDYLAAHGIAISKSTLGSYLRELPAPASKSPAKKVS